MNKPTRITIDDVVYVREDSIKQFTPKLGQSVYQVGAKLFIRTVTFHYVGLVTFVSDTEIVMENVGWVADSGRFAKALKTGNLNEIEMYPPGSVSIGRGAIVDSSFWSHALPTETK
jgi:hypothetical protein